MPEKHDDASEAQKAAEVVGVILVANDKSPEVLKPGEEAFDSQPSLVSSEFTLILRHDLTVPSIGSDHFDAPILQKPRVKPVAVVGLVANQFDRNVRYESLMECFLDESCLMG